MTGKWWVIYITEHSFEGHLWLSSFLLGGLGLKALGDSMFLSLLEIGRLRKTGCEDEICCGDISGSGGADMRGCEVARGDLSTQVNGLAGGAEEVRTVGWCGDGTESRGDEIGG